MKKGVWATDYVDEYGKWIYIEDSEGFGHEEPLSDWERKVNYYLHKRDGRKIAAVKMTI